MQSFLLQAVLFVELTSVDCFNYGEACVNLSLVILCDWSIWFSLFEPYQVG